jgi:hypothetical protein
MKNRNPWHSPIMYLSDGITTKIHDPKTWGTMHRHTAACWYEMTPADKMAKERADAAHRINTRQGF